MRVCQVRHDGKWSYIAAAARKPPYQEDLHFYSTDTVPRVKHRVGWIYSSFAVIVIFAFNTFDTGHPFSAFSAHF
jgi:hypothetical protein